MKKLITTALMLVALCFSFGSMAASKIGVIDVHKLIEQSPEVKALNKRITREFTPRRQKIVDLQATIEKKAQRLKRDFATMSDSEKSSIQSSLMTERRNLQRLQQDFQQDISMLQNKEMKKFFTRLKKTVDSYAKKNDYDLILQKDAAPFASKKVDVTNAVLRSMS